MVEGSIANMSIIVRDMIRNYYNLDDSSRLDLDRAIGKLIERDALVGDDLIILRLTLDGVHYTDVARTVGVVSRKVSRRIAIIADKLSDELGEEYQDDKIIKEVERRLGRPLTDEEMAFCWQVIKTGHPLKKGLSIFNFKVGDDGFIFEDKTEG
ncbi:MAG: hypothetical protein PHW33_03930 [Candidatus Portnoybacteria bacterium]|jgi:hypothetical protein|nr:hypothetical protein [Candidatus Portnoybacteria bacterium]